MQRIEGGIVAPSRFRAAGVNVGIKPGSTKKDCALVVSDAPATVAGVFTTNIMKAAPVLWDIEVCQKGRSQAVFINSGNANAATGDKGYADTQVTAELVAAGFGVDPAEVCVCSTGVIGVPLPMDRISAGVNDCLRALSESGGHDAAEAIMTTDTVPKEMALELDLSDGPVRIGAMAKGSGMICPNMATMICIVTTDAAVEPFALQGVLSKAVKNSFNRICVDNDMSTSDTLLCLANGQSGVRIDPETDDGDLFAAGIETVCREMARQIVLDGEGASKFVEIRVEGAESDEDAAHVARAIAQSQLCKTAFAGEDANIGRLVCAAGYAGVGFEPEDLAVWLGDLAIVRNGMTTEYSEEEAAALMREHEIRVKLRIGNGAGESFYWTSDLTHEYVSINADYRT